MIVSKGTRRCREEVLEVRDGRDLAGGNALSPLFRQHGSGCVPVHFGFWIYQIDRLHDVALRQQMPSRAPEIADLEHRIPGQLAFKGTAPGIALGRGEILIQRRLDSERIVRRLLLRE